MYYIITICKFEEIYTKKFEEKTPEEIQVTFVLSICIIVIQYFVNQSLGLPNFSCFSESEVCGIHRRSWRICQLQGNDGVWQHGDQHEYANQ